MGAFLSEPDILRTYQACLASARHAERSAEAWLLVRSRFLAGISVAWRAALQRHCVRASNGRFGRKSLTQLREFGGVTSVLLARRRLSELPWDDSSVLSSKCNGGDRLVRSAVVCRPTCISAATPSLPGLIRTQRTAGQSVWLLFLEAVALHRLSLSQLFEASSLDEHLSRATDGPISATVLISHRARHLELVLCDPVL